MSLFVRSARRLACAAPMALPRTCSIAARPPLPIDRRVTRASVGINRPALPMPVRHSSALASACFGALSVYSFSRAGKDDKEYTDTKARLEKMGLLSGGVSLACLLNAFMKGKNEPAEAKETEESKEGAGSVDVRIATAELSLALQTLAEAHLEYCLAYAIKEQSDIMKATISNPGQKERLIENICTQTLTAIDKIVEIMPSIEKCEVSVTIKALLRSEFAKLAEVKPIAEWDECMWDMFNTQMKEKLISTLSHAYTIKLHKDWKFHTARMQ